MKQHLLRELPPGFGGVERVSHCLACEVGGTVFYLNRGIQDNDPFKVPYERRLLKSFNLGRIYFPFLTLDLFKFLTSRGSLIAHLPCPTVLLLVLIAKRIRRKRFISIYWHSFIAPRGGIASTLETIYQYIAFKLVKDFPVLVTSPVVKKSLIQKGFSSNNIDILPCSLPAISELNYQRINDNRNRIPKGKIIAICRLDSYKRVDWLIDAFSRTDAAKELIILGDGPNRIKLELYSKSTIRLDQNVSFFGRVDEDLKLKLISECDLLVLPADRCNEAFGIVQLEAMASGIPSIAYDLPNSGMYWVSKLPSLAWNGKPTDLATCIQKLLTNSQFYAAACKEAYMRYETEFSSYIWKKRIRGILKKYPILNE